MSDTLKTRRWMAAWVFPLALLALPNCFLDGGAYPGAGITLGPALTFGYIAGRELAQAAA